MITWASVDLPEPFGPITAWTWPLSTSRSTPRRISWPPTAARSRETTSLLISRPLPRRRPRRAPHRRAPAWSREATAVRRSRARTCCRASSTRSPARPPRPHRPTANSPRGCTGRLWRRRRRRCGRHRRASVRRRNCGPYPARSRPTGTGAWSSESRATAKANRKSLAQTSSKRFRRQALEYLVEEAEHDQTFSHLGRHTTALEVVTLLLVDRPDGRRVAATHVVRLDLEVGHRLGARAFGQHEIAVGLECVRARRLLPHADEARVHALGRVGDRALEHEVAGRLRSGVVLHRAEVVHAGARAEVDGQE